MSFKDKWKKVTSEIKSRYKYMRGDKGILESDYEKIKQWQPDNEFAKADKEHSLAWVDFTWFLFCLTKFAAKDAKSALNALLLDNVFIDKWEKNKKNIKTNKDDSEFKKFFKNLQKNNPRVAATLQLWMVYSLLVSMVVGGIKISGHHDNDYKKTNKEQVVDNTQELDESLLVDEDDDFYSVQEETNDDLFDMTTDEVKDVVKYNVANKSFVTDFVNDNWNEIVIGVLAFETWRTKPKLQSGEPRYTYGPGLTWVYIKQYVKGKPMEIQNACNGIYVKKAQNFSVKQVFDQVRRHCLYKTECMNVMQRKLKQYGFKEITDEQAFGLFVAGYQLPGRLNGIIHRLKDAGSDVQKQIDAFQAGKEVEERWRKGTNIRRWWCAMLYIGKITPDDLLNMDRDAFSKITINTIMKNGHFVCDDNTIAYALNLKKPRNGSVKAFIKKHNILTSLVTKHKKSDVKIDETNDNVSMKELNEGLNAFRKNDYETAIKHYKSAIDLDENNMEAYSSLALTYRKLGDQTHNISDYEKVFDVVNQCNAIMNKNKSLLHDPAIKAATYYNAGTAREKIAQIQVQNNKKEEALKNYKKAKLNFETAYTNASEMGNSDRMSVYENAKKRIDKAIKDLKTKKNKAFAFNEGILKIKNKQKNNTVVYPFDNEHRV